MEPLPILCKGIFCWKQTLEEVGVVINEGDYYPMEGSSLHKIAEKYTGSQEQQFIEQTRRKEKKLYVDLYKHETLAFYPGVSQINTIFN